MRATIVVSSWSAGDPAAIAPSTSLRLCPARQQADKLDPKEQAKLLHLHTVHLHHVPTSVICMPCAG
jgi:hypothetical protein